MHYALPLAAGVFLYLALAGVVPELQRAIDAETCDPSPTDPARRDCPLSMRALAAIGIVVGLSLMAALIALPHNRQAEARGVGGPH